MKPYPHRYSVDEVRAAYDAGYREIWERMTGVALADEAQPGMLASSHIIGPQHGTMYDLDPISCARNQGKMAAKNIATDALRAAGAPSVAGDLAAGRKYWDLRLGQIVDADAP